jgi:formylglycine-generating enzyme required for sulfatase activity
MSRKQAIVDQRRQPAWPWQVALIIVCSVGIAVGCSVISSYGLLPATAPISRPAIPPALETGLSLAGTLPPLPITTTLALPWVAAQLPQHLPLIQYEQAFNLPTAPHPPDGAQGQSLNTFLQWQLENPSEIPVQIQVRLEANQQTPQTIIYQGDSESLAFDPATFTVETQYYWQVVTIDGRGRQTAGPIWTFRTEGQPAIPAVETMIPIPAGEFQMGCDEARAPAGGCNEKDTPLHRVYLDAYEIDKYEVTNQQYRECVHAGFCQPPRRDGSHSRSRYFWHPPFDDFPVLYVSWWDAQNYCKWQGKRLPTEAEWEKAARGPIDTRTWPWGEEPIDCTRANYTNDTAGRERRCVGDTTQVGSYPAGASPYGLMDVAGNAFEWVGDIWDQHYQIRYYAISPYENPTGPALSRSVHDNPYFVIRGGSYRPRWNYPRTFHRHHGHHGDRVGGDQPLYRNDQVGFRCARPLAESP